MSGIIEEILQKPNWEEKIKNPEITTKWREELHQQGVSNRVIDKAFEVLTPYNLPGNNKIIDLQKAYQESLNGNYEEESDYEWHLTVGVAPDDIWPSEYCSCECLICHGEEHLAQELEDYDEDDEDYQEIQNRLKKYKKVKCTCSNFRIIYPLEFLRRHLYHNIHLISKTLKKRFVHHVHGFQYRQGGKIDYHPGSNNQMIDIIHPSLYCYVKGVTTVEGEEGELLKNKAGTFQWLPAEFSVQRDSSGKPVRTEIRSYINNLDRNDPANNGLYEDIGEIFTEMIPGFEKILNDLKGEKRIHALEENKTLSLTDIQLQDCQVIVKIANAKVNTENPTFNEGSWHLEGIEKEKIIATGIYYYDIKNIQKNFLRFRTSLNSNIYNLNYPQNCHEYVRYHYGLKLAEDGAITTIGLGRIPTKENLCLVFPNFLQHRVSKLTLAEGATEGSRGILVFFLINPFEKVISTAHVPPQQTSVTVDEANSFRELLMFERKFEYSNQNAFHQRAFSLCEH